MPRRRVDSEESEDEDDGERADEQSEEESEEESSSDSESSQEDKDDDEDDNEDDKDDDDDQQGQRGTKEIPLTTSMIEDVKKLASVISSRCTAHRHLDKMDDGDGDWSDDDDDEYLAARGLGKWPRRVYYTGAITDGRFHSSRATLEGRLPSCNHITSQDCRYVIYHGGFVDGKYDTYNNFTGGDQPAFACWSNGTGMSFKGHFSGGLRHNHSGLTGTSYFSFPLDHRSAQCPKCRHPCRRTFARVKYVDLQMHWLSSNDQHKFPAHVLRAQLQVHRPRR